LIDRADQPAARRRRPLAGDIAFYGLTIGAVLLGWQIAIQPLLKQAPVEVAIRLAPGSPTVLSRSAESELIAGRVENAAALSRDALGRSPFDVRALRVFGLTEARAGREDAADDILTLAGNWSLRDDPSHAWLVERRLRRGDYASSFAHADTLVRRRDDIRPQVFRLFTAAGTLDPQRSLPVIVKLLAAKPPWRDDYLGGLTETPEDLQLAARLAVLLEAGRAPFSPVELQHLYLTLLNKGQLEAMRTVRSRLNRPPIDVAVANGGFADADAPAPFQWRLVQKAGVAAEIVADDLRPSNPALRIDYDGYASAQIAEQLILLEQGSYHFSVETRSESGAPSARLSWTLTCAPGGGVIGALPAGEASARRNVWTSLSGRFEVPAGCPAQWLRLETRADDRRSPTMVWFDRITLSPAR